ncbi:putative aldo-keto reductase 1, partial [Camellia lanceoleosa]
VSKLGYRCMGLTSMYNSLIPEEDGIAIIKYAFSIRITFFDASDVYGANNANEILVGKIQLATKFGIVKLDPTQIVVHGSVEYVRSCCQASLKRLGVDYIDLYYVHRIDTSIGELKKLAEEGKIKYIGLSEASPNTIRRELAVHPITALQMEYSLLTRDIEEEIIPICRCFILLPKFTCILSKMLEIPPLQPLRNTGTAVTHVNFSHMAKAGALKDFPREKVQLATKFGIVKMEPTQVVVKDTVEYVRSCCEASLKPLGVDYIDLYYVHRIDTSVPIEETVTSPNTIRRAHAVHPITALQMEYSFLTREIEEEIIPLCRELGIVIVPYSPTAHGFFVGKAVVKSVPTYSFLVSKLGYGCMGLTRIYNSLIPDEDGIAIIKYAFSKGITFFDTSDIYGANNANEILVGKALKDLPREKVQLATKFGIVKMEPTQVVVKGTVEYVRFCCEARLKRLGVDYIDLCYVHWIYTELRIAIVPYSPTAHGFFASKAVAESVPTDSFLVVELAHVFAKTVLRGS